MTDEDTIRSTALLTYQTAKVLGRAANLDALEFLQVMTINLAITISTISNDDAHNLILETVITELTEMVARNRKNLIAMGKIKDVPQTLELPEGDTDR